MSCAEFCQHLCHDRLQLGQVNRRDLPKLLVVEALIFMPQDVADSDNGGPRRIGIFGEVIRRQRFRGFRNDLHGGVPPRGDANSYLGTAQTKGLERS